MKTFWCCRKSKPPATTLTKPPPPGSFCVVFYRKTGLRYSKTYTPDIMWFKNTLKASDDFKNKQQNIFLYVKVYIFWKFIQYTIHWDKTQVLKKLPSDKINVTKIALSFLSRAPTHHTFTFICNSYTSWSTRFISLKLSFH